MRCDMMVRYGGEAWCVSSMSCCLIDIHYDSVLPRNAMGSQYCPVQSCAVPMTPLCCAVPCCVLLCLLDYDVMRSLSVHFL